MKFLATPLAAGTAKMLTAGNIGSKCAAVHQVLGRPALKTPVDGHSKLILDTYKNVQPVQLSDVTAPGHGRTFQLLTT